MPKSPALSSPIEKEKLQLQQRKSLGEDTTKSSRELILLEKLPAGLPLSERYLVNALLISRTSNHEAMQVLKTEGLINYTLTRRSHVADLKLEELAQYLAVIGISEVLGELACPNARDKVLNKQKKEKKSQ